LYDVIIVGAGPSGAALSYFLVKKGFNVLTLERDPKPATRVICGEYLPDPDSLGMPKDISKAYWEFFRPFIVHRIKRISMEIENRRFTTEYIGYSIDRANMIRKRLMESVENGLSLSTKEAFLTAKLGDGCIKVITSKGEYRTKFLVGADGFGSKVARSSGLHNVIKCDDLALAFTNEVNLDLPDPEEMRLIINEELAPGTYAWVIPRSPSRANVGLGVRLSMKRSFNPVRAMKKFFKELKIKKEPILRGRYVPVGGISPRIVSHGVFLLGDAACMVIPSNGGGMHLGIIAAYLLSNSLEGEPERRYERAVREYIKPVVDLGLVHRKAADFLTRTGLLRRTVGLLPNNMVSEVIKVVKGNYYPLIKVMASMYDFLDMGRSGSYPRC